MEDRKIGWLIDGRAYCDWCAATFPIGKHSVCKLYASNVLPYRQPCADCGAILCDGGARVALFD